MSRIDDMLESFGQSKWFITLDLASGYWQVGIKKKDIEKTVFVTPFRLYEFLVMPFGLSYAPETFQCLMNRVLQDFLGDFIAIYLNNVIIHIKRSFKQYKICPKTNHRRNQSSSKSRFCKNASRFYRNLSF